MDIHDLRESIEYDPETGDCFWLSRPVDHFKNESVAKAWNSRNAGTKVGTKSVRTANTYLMFQLFGKLLYLHRAIWLLMTEQHADTVDHINGNGLDNRWVNLRSVPLAENLRNRSNRKNRVLPLGIWQRPNGKFVARVGAGISGKKKYLGTFATIEDAVLAKKEAEIELGYHQNHGNR